MSAGLTTFEGTHAILLRQFAADRMKVKHQSVKGAEEAASHVITLERQWGKLTTLKLVFLDGSPKVKSETQFVLVHQHDGSRCTRASLHNVWPFVKNWNDAGHKPAIRLVADARKVTVVIEGSTSPYGDVATIDSCQQMLMGLEEEYRAIRAGIAKALSREEKPAEAADTTWTRVKDDDRRRREFWNVKVRYDERISSDNHTTAMRYAPEPSVAAPAAPPTRLST